MAGMALVEGEVLPRLQGGAALMVVGADRLIVVQDRRKRYWVFAIDTYSFSNESALNKKGGPYTTKEQAVTVAEELGM